MRRWARSLPRALWLVVALNALTLCAYSFLFAPYRGPDEALHVDLVLDVRQHLEYPSYDGRRLSRRIERSLPLVANGRESRALRSEEAPERSARPALGDLGPDEPGKVPNQLAQHPPLYYGLMAAALAPLGGALVDDVSFDKTVAVMRLLNVLLLAGLPLIAYALARRLGGSQAAGLAAALLPLAVPLASEIGASVNNDNLLTLLLALEALLLVQVAGGDWSRRTAVVVGVIGGLALLTKAFALFVPAWIAAAYWLAARRGHTRGLGVPMISIALATAIGGWWWARNLIVFGSLSPAISITPRPPSSFDPDFGYWAGRFLSWMPQRFWGWFGHFEIHMAPALTIAASVILIAAIGLAVSARRRAGLDRAATWLALVPALVILAAVALRAHGEYADTGQAGGIQGRYLFPGLVGLGAAAGLGWERLASGRVAYLPLAALGVAAAMQIAALRTIVPFYWGTPGASSANHVRALLDWSPWPETVTIGTVLAATGVGIWLATELWRGARASAALAE